MAWSKLGSLAERCHAYTKALRYKELEFEEALPSRELVEGLVSINYLLGQTEAAKGILEYHSPTLADDTASVENHKEIIVTQCLACNTIDLACTSTDTGESLRQR